MAQEQTQKLSGKEVRVLLISSDRDIFTEGSGVRRRIEHYGSYFKELHVIVYTLVSHGFTETVEIAENVWAYPTNSSSRFKYPFDAYKMFKRQMVFQGRSHCHVVSTQDPFESGLAGALIKRKYEIALHVQIHTDIFDSYFTRNSWLNKVRRIIAWYVLDNVHCVRVVSERIKEKLLKRYPELKEHVQVLPIHTDTQQIADTEPTRDLHEIYPQYKFIVFMASRLTEEKDYPTALEAIAKARMQYSFIGLIIAGEGKQRKSLERQAEKLGISGAVQFVGWHNDLVSYYKTANVFLLTSRYEGYGRTLLEAAAAQVPIISTDVGLAGSVFKNEEHALICAQGDSDCLATNIIRVLKDRPLRRKLAINAAPLAQAETYEEYLDRFCEGIMSCLQ